MTLFAARYDTARTTILEQFPTPARIGVRCALPGWLQRLEVTVRAKSKHDAYRRYRDHLGDGMALIDGYGVPIVDGWVYEVVPDGRHVHYICGGGWKRMSDEQEQDAPTSGTQDTDAYLKSVLTAHAPAINSDQSNIDATSTDIGDAFELKRNTGSTPAEIVEAILPMGNSSDEIIDFWLEPAPAATVTLQNPIPYLKARQSTGTIDWRVRRRDLIDETFSRHIWDLANNVLLYFTWTTKLNGAHTAGDTTLTVDSITNFSAGDEVEIELDGEKTYRTYITASSGSTLTVNDGLPHSASDDAVISKRDPLQDTGVESDSASVSAFWTRYRRLVVDDLIGSHFDQTAANQLRGTVLGEFKDPVQKASFTIGAGRIRDGNAGVLWPTYYLLRKPTYISITDLFVSPELAGVTLDGSTALFTHSLDYDHNSRRMRVTPDAFFGDNRLDVLLQKLGMRVGQGVQA